MLTISAQLFVNLVTLVAILHVILLGVAYLILLERKIASWVQDRIGPNRTGFSFGQEFLPKFHFWGLGQPLADGIKFILKEDYTPPFVEKTLFILAPVAAAIPAMIGWMVIPWGGYWNFPGFTLGPLTVEAGTALVAGSAVNVGILYVLAVGSLGVYGVVLAGFASNNKYSFFGGIRATAQMLSYEVPLGLGVLIIILMNRSPRADVIAAMQHDGIWNIVYQPLLAVIFLACNLAETNRAPFDLAEAEQELVGGYHTEYSSMKFALFFLGEYMHMITGAAFFTLLFLGGSDIPGVQEPVGSGLGWVLIKTGVFLAKVALMISLVMLIRWTLPRFRFDQLMRLAWRGLIPMTLALLLCTGGLVFARLMGVIDETVACWLMLAANLAVGAATIIIGKMMPKDVNVNRRVPLAGSRFSPQTANS